MTDIYLSKAKIEEETEKPRERISVKQIRKMIGHTGSDALLTSYSTFPAKICFETQEETEAVVLFLRQHWVVNIPWKVMVIFFLALPSVFIFFPPYANLPAVYQFVVTISWYMFITGYALTRFMGWFFNIYIVTDERIVDVDFINIFFRKISTAKIDEIQDINVSSSGAIETLFGYGSVTIQTSAAIPEFDFMYVPHPDRVGKILNHLIEHEDQEKLEGRIK